MKVWCLSTFDFGFGIQRNSPRISEQGASLVSQGEVLVDLASSVQFAKGEGLHLILDGARILTLTTTPCSKINPYRGSTSLK